MGVTTKIIAESDEMRAVLLQLESAAAFEALPVHITGETGTGKELAARWVHLKSARARASFVAINCAALPDSLLEAELFGHARGAFTGAERVRHGLLAEAHRGTLFLDEVADLSSRAQSTLLRALQEKEFRRLGDSALHQSDFRVLSASHKDIATEVDAGRFRQDLMFRLKVLQVELPPLRHRASDILPLAKHCLHTRARSLGLATLSLSYEAEKFLLSYAWPGNVRELENELVQALVRAQGGTEVGVEHLSPHLPVSAKEELKGASREFERRFLTQSLARHRGNRTRTAHALGLSRQGLYRKLKRLGITFETTTL